MPAARSRGRAERGTPKAKPRSDAYVGLLAISLLALTAAMLFAFLNYNTYPEGKPKPVQVAPKAAQAPAAGVPAGVPAANPPQPGEPQPGQPQPQPAQPKGPPAPPPPKK